MSTVAYANLVSGATFETAEICDVNLTISVQILLKVLHAMPGLGRIVIGALLNAAYEVDGAARARRLYKLFQLSRRKGFDNRDRRHHEQLERELVLFLKGNKGKG